MTAREAASTGNATPSPRRPRRSGIRSVRSLATLLTVALVGACAAPDPTGEAPSSSSPPTRAPAAGPPQVTITVNDVELTATLRGTAAARGLRTQLPLTLTMRDHGGVEKTGPLPTPLPVNDQPDAADPAPSDLGYFAPGNDLVLYYGDQSSFPGIVILGSLEGDVGSLAETTDDVRVTVSATG